MSTSEPGNTDEAAEFGAFSDLPLLATARRAIEGLPTGFGGAVVTRAYSEGIAAAALSSVVASIRVAAKKEARAEMEALYVRPDGIEDAEWMRPYRELVEQRVHPNLRAKMNAAFDAIYNHAVEERSAEHDSLLGIVRALFKDAAAVEVATPTEPQS